MQFLNKRAGARFLDVPTYKISCENKDLKTIESLKSAEEVVEFTHVIKHKLPVVVKIHDADSNFADNEIKCLKTLSRFKYAVQYLCDFECYDDKSRWMNKLKKKTKFCVHSKDKLRFIVMEYIEGGDLYAYLESKDKPQKELFSFLMQIALVICILATKYHIYHGDLNTGNILIERTAENTIDYRLLGKKYRVETYGVYPKFIDFGRSGFYDERFEDKDILEDVYLIFNVVSAWLPIDSQKLLRHFVKTQCKLRHKTIAEFFEAFASLSKN